MSTIRAASRKAPDPFRLGWRYVNETTAQGEEVSRQVPLTEEDVLHPQEGDHIVNTPVHGIIAAYLNVAIKSRFLHRSDVVVLGDTRVDWGSPYGWIHGPDVAQFDRVKGGWSLTRGTFQLKKTGGRSLLNVEVTSPATRKGDLGAKRREYFLVGVPTYVIVDIPQVDDGAIRLLAFQAGETKYEPLPADDKGRIWLESAGLWLGAEGMNVFLEDDKGNRLPEYDQLAEMVETLKKTVKKADQARKRAEQKTQSAEKRVAELEKELARLRNKS